MNHDWRRRSVDAENGGAVFFCGESLVFIENLW